MYDTLCGIRFKGKMFDNERDFSFFSNEGENSCPTRVGIVYGKNGSGKSTLTKAFQKCSDVSNTSILSASLYDFEKKQSLRQMRLNKISLCSMKISSRKM